MPAGFYHGKNRLIPATGINLPTLVKSILRHVVISRGYHFITTSSEGHQPSPVVLSLLRCPTALSHPNSPSDRDGRGAVSVCQSVSAQGPCRWVVSVDHVYRPGDLSISSMQLLCAGQPPGRATMPQTPPRGVLRPNRRLLTMRSSRGRQLWGCRLSPAGRE